MIFDYATLKLIWWAGVGIMLIIFAMSDGWDLGIGILSPFIARTDDERRLTLRTVEPNWEGNQTWLIIAGALLFAAWPLVYAASFSGMYVALLLVLFALFFRPVGFKYRNKVENATWRRAWDWGLFIGGLVPSLVFGVAFGNLLQGVPFHFDSELRAHYTGTFWQLLNPFALLAGVISLAMMVTHGASYLALRLEEGELNARAARASRYAALAFIVAFAAAGFWVAYGIDGYRITALPDVQGAPNPLAKTVVRAPGAWLENFSRFRWMIAAPVAAFAGAIAVVLLARTRLRVLALASSGLTIAGVILTAGFAMFPFVMPSASEPKSSLTAWDSVSSHGTLQVMFWVVVIFVPLIAIYVSWAYAKMRGKINLATLTEEQ
jgi:cytochrome d ubiquinol oxidase subunit II